MKCGHVTISRTLLRITPPGTIKTECKGALNIDNTGNTSEIWKTYPILTLSDFSVYRSISNFDNFRCTPKCRNRPGCHYISFLLVFNPSNGTYTTCYSIYHSHRLPTQLASPLKKAGSTGCCGVL